MVRTFGGEFPTRGRGSSSGRSGQPHPSGQSTADDTSPTRPEMVAPLEQHQISPDRQSGDRGFGRGSSRGMFRGRGRGGRPDVRQMSEEPRSEDRHEMNGDRMIPTGPAADEKEAASMQQQSGPFKKVLGTESAPLSLIHI